jgi:hypothetical protein
MPIIRVPSALSANSEAIDILCANPDKLFGDCLSANLKAIVLLELYAQHRNYVYLAQPPSIFIPTWEDVLRLLVDWAK